MKIVRKIIEIDEERCDGCGQCVPACAEGSLAIIDGKARVVSDNLCDGLGACLGECPNDALHIVEREADEFDEEAVETHLAGREETASAAGTGGGCPSSRIDVFAPAGAPGVPRPAAVAPEDSALTHWPIQIRLVPPDAPFLRGADLLVLADCSAVAVPNLHSELLAGKVVMMGCPKFDDAEAYVEKFRQIFRRAGLRSVTTVAMEVPCCSALPAIVRQALAKAGSPLPLEEQVVRIRDGRVEPAERHPETLPLAGS